MTTKDELLSAQRVLRALNVGDAVTVMKDGRELAMTVSQYLQGSDFAFGRGGNIERCGSWEGASVKVTFGPGRYSTNITVSAQAAKSGMPYVKEEE